MLHLFHCRPAADGSLPADLWETVEAETTEAALVAGLKIHLADRPVSAWVSLGKYRHPNGTPLTVKHYTMSWEG